MLYRGINPCSLHPGISIAKEIPPGTVTSQLETLLGSSGEVIVGRTIKQAEYTVRINIAGKYRAQAWEIRKLLAGWACGADTETGELRPTHWPDVHYDAILKEISPPEFTFGFGTIDVVFTIPRPIAASNVLQTEASLDSGTVKPVIGGSTHARPVISLECKSAESVFLNVDMKNYLQVSGPFEAGEYLEITADPPNVRLRSTDGTWSSANDRIDFANSRLGDLSMAFVPGERVVMSPHASQIKIQWRDEWL